MFVVRFVDVVACAYPSRPPYKASEEEEEEADDAMAKQLRAIKLKIDAHKLHNYIHLFDAMLS